MTLSLALVFLFEEGTFETFAQWQPLFLLSLPSRVNLYVAT